MIRLIEDNVALRLEPLNENRGPLTVVRERAKVELRWARVLATGPGHYTECSFLSPKGYFVPVELQAGDTVMVTSAAGHDYRRGLDLYTTPRQNDKAEFNELFGERGEYRVIRGEEALVKIVNGQPQALGRFVLCRRERPTMTPGGIHIPDSLEDKTRVAEIVSVGRGRVLRDGSFRAPEPRVGDRVLVGQHAGLELALPGVDGLLLLREEDIVGVFEETERAESAA